MNFQASFFRGEKTLSLLFFIALTLVFTHPLILQLDRSIEFPDTYFFAWVLWWTKKALIELHQNPFVTDFMCQPTGAQLYLTTMSLANGVLSIPLQVFFSPMQSLNILFLSQFILAGYGVFILSRYLGGRRLSSLYAGVIYSFSSFHFNQVTYGFLNISSIQWIPFYLLYLIKTVREKDARNPLYAAVFLLLTAFSSWEHLYHTFFLSCLLVPLEVYNARRQNLAAAAKRMLLVGVITGLLISPVAFHMMKQASIQKHSKSPLEHVAFNAADVASLVTPDAANPRFGGSVQAVYSRFQGFPYTVVNFIGYTVIFMTLLSLLSRPSKRNLFWLFIAAVFLLLSLGPNLHYKGEVVKDSGGNPLIMPYKALWRYMPLFDLSQRPNRFSNVRQLGLALFIGVSFKLLSLFEGERARVRILSVVVFLLLVASAYQEHRIPFNLTRYPIYRDLPVYDEMRVDGREYVVLDLPTYYGEQGALFRATKHGRKTVDCFISRIDDKVYGRLSKHVATLDFLHRPLNTGLTPADRKDLVAKLFKENNIGFVILCRPYTERDMNLLGGLFEELGGQLRGEWDGIRVYDVTRISAAAT